MVRADRGAGAAGLGEPRSELESLSRGLAVLKLLNEDGPSSIAQCCRRLDLPRTTIRRILDTLIAEQCCLKFPNSRLYGLAPGVEKLSYGYSDADRLTAAGRAILQRLSQQTGWPSALAVPEGLTMRVRLSTDYENPVALARMRPGYATPQVETTTGLLVLASLDAQETTARLDETYSRAWSSPLRFTRSEVEGFIAQARADGCLIIERRFPEASLGVPVHVHGVVRGGVVMRYHRAAVRSSEARANLLPKVRAAAVAIDAAVSDQWGAKGAVTGS